MGRKPEVCPLGGVVRCHGKNMSDIRVSSLLFGCLCRDKEACEVLRSVIFLKWGGEV